MSICIRNYYRWGGVEDARDAGVQKLYKLMAARSVADYMRTILGPRRVQSV